ncbi:DNA-binding NarL/FixJ family response regulator [Catenuloplanes nepalensis]|uniref:DNA-binding NarL/FixJ family response regulator n=1 Tax=Catenuloplanes nepalensis TaxID=587533 RepID=A0ABT9MS88_9ACTN|nr:response regulator transcription factor [Catenuloplanes nepalensis]MDP9794300.1 DNA-binding NarL/FixJ family response regulator [Catenuloplanes nepalensis]
MTSDVNEPVRVLVASERPLLRAGLTALLGRQPGIDVVAEACDGTEAIGAAGRHRPGVAVLDLPAPEPATATLAGQGIRVLILTPVLNRPVAHRVLRAGASGFLLSDTDPAVLLGAVRAVARGGAWLDADLLGDLLREFVTRPVAVAASGADLDRLTPREREVLALIAQGLDNAGVARRLYVAECTVKTHLGRVLAKLGLHDRAQAVSAAYRCGLVRSGAAA